MGVGRKRMNTAAAHLVRTAQYAQQAARPPALLVAGLLSAQREPEAGQLVGRDPCERAAGHEVRRRGRTGRKVAAASHSGSWVASHLQTARARRLRTFVHTCALGWRPEVSAAEGLLRGSRDRPAEQRVALLYPLGVHRQLGEPPRARMPHPTFGPRHVIDG